MDVLVVVVELAVRQLVKLHVQKLVLRLVKHYVIIHVPLNVKVFVV